MSITGPVFVLGEEIFFPYESSQIHELIKDRACPPC